VADLLCDPQRPPALDVRAGRPRPRGGDRLAGDAQRRQADLGSGGEAQGVANAVEFYGGTANDLHGGGHKLSGMGRELGMHALDLCTEVKNVFVDLRVVGRGA
jgi:hypothetical protein